MLNKINSTSQINNLPSFYDLVK